MESQIIKIQYDDASKNSGIQGVQNSEYLLRMHFLNQATEIISDPSLQRFYASEMKNIAKRQVLRIDPDIKNGFCKRCNSKLEQEHSFYQLRGKKKSRCTIIECPHCLYINKVFNGMGGSVVIKEESISQV